MIMLPFVRGGSTTCNFGKNCRSIESYQQYLYKYFSILKKTISFPYSSMIREPVPLNSSKLTKVMLLKDAIESY